jgi:hypothetical protein
MALRGIMTGIQPSAISAVIWTLFGEEDGDVRAHGLEPQREAAIELEPLTLVHQRVAAHEHVDDLHGLADARERGVERDAVELLDDVCARRAETDDRAAAGPLVERCEVLRECRGRARVDIDDARRELDLLRLLRQRDEERKRVAAPGLGHPEGVDATVVGDLREGEGVFLLHVELPGNGDGELAHAGHTSDGVRAG